MAKERSIPAPLTNPETEPFWAAAREGRFLLRACTACGRAHWYPRAVCPFCMSEKTEWREASGRGEIYSVSVMKRAPEVYAVAYVTLEEGPTMMTNIVDCDFDALAIGQAVALTWRPTQGDGPPYPQFKPA
ncbi:Zn-ribbon domain-containing OB-fold protein [Roseicella sp. DB1501]|uniref:Zn-ribbon domain-containing OB-fold protein n=1 Tax=Roseicella sp. DB1501 TaxID=2730925 RepID=UPI00149237EA|nr:OB-fold domain-containing protein [Roseicella sp. DB1501]NOG73868.1 DNA-binding protein [Roseicella sp. DB1501]